MGARFDRRRRIVGALGAALLVGAGLHRAAGAGDASQPVVLVNRWHEEAAGGDPKALDRVIAEYREPRLNDTLRGLLVTTVTDAANGDGAFARFRAWREHDDGPRDAWLWYRTLLVESERNPQAARDAAVSASGAVARAGAVHALAAWADPDALTTLPAALKANAERGAARSVLVEAWAHVLAAEPGRSGTPEFAAAVEALLPTLSDEDLEPRTRLEVARALGRAFETDQLSFDPRWWRTRLSLAEPPKNPEDARYAPPTTTYFDLRATGDRVVYVLDASGSMDSALSPPAREELVLMLAAEAARAGTRFEIPWKDVRTSLQAVAEFTKLSIRQLPKDASFCVIVFGDDGRALSATPGLVAASAGSVAAAAKELDTIARGSGNGGTNLHGGLRRAFLATPGGRDLDAGRAADPLTLFARGPTTIFLLSDGEPTHDDWSLRGGQNIGGMSVFSATDGICDDVERANLLQGCEIHTLAFGMRGNALLERLARLGGGHCRSIGSGDSIAGRRPPDPRALDLDGLLARLGIPTSPPLPDADVVGRLHPHFALARDADERLRIACALALKGDRTMIPILLDAISEAPDAAAGTAEHTLSSLTKHSFGWAAGLRRFERIALRRNWSWFARSPRSALVPAPVPRVEPVK